jgi:hypothetical protein
MRKLLYIFIVTFSITSCCDCIDNPIPESTGDLDWNLYPFDTTSTPYPWPTFTANNNTEKNILLEDYTGHTCTNCPAAADIAHQLEANHPDRVFVASVHASPDGSFQAVQPPEFNIDFTTLAGNTYVNEMPGFLGNPMGTINRQSTGFLNTVWYFSTDWTTAVNNEISSSSLKANIQLAYNYYEQTNGLFIHTESEFKDNLTGDYNLIIYLLRDTVIAPQKLNNGTTEHHYHHHAVLSNNINGTWGTSIATGSVANGDVFYNDYSYQLPDPLVDSTYNIDNLSLITYLCERNSFEVIQVIKTELAP